MTTRELAKSYDPARVESRIYAFWNSHGLFRAAPSPGRKPFTVMIPPPNVTGILHMGHVLDNTIQDVVVRWRRMQGYETLWQPGTDHAGIATQNVVEKKLREEGTTREELGRERFLERVWKWRDEYGGTIIRQLHRLGASCDWERERFTMDEGLSRAVDEVFLRLFEKGLVYRGNYIVNWCPRCRTAISDEEVDHEEIDGRLYYVTYPFPGELKGITVATTRPETILGDVAVAVNPDDERYADLVGRKVVLPFLGREIPIIADAYVEKEFGAGALKVTPAHDVNDFEIGRRHGLEPIVAIDDQGRMNENAGPFQGMDRFEARRAVVAQLKEQGLLVKVVDHKLSLGHCHRCDTVIEPILSRQWFVKMQPLAEPAIRALEDGRIRFVPEHWNKVYLNWMRNIRDWCISRQLWWGHRIPVWYCDSCGEPLASRGAPAGACPRCQGTAWTQDSDVLDTWFSSWLWPFSTLGWPESTPELKYFYPTSYLTTGPDIIFFWVARMVMAGLEFTGQVPFPVVYLHGIVRDDKGRKMSKSLGNSPDPLDLIDKYGADALRYTMILLTPTGQDVLFTDKKVEVGRNFANKIWNAARLALAQMEGFDPAAADPVKRPLETVDRWILSRLDETVAAVTADLENFRYNEAARTLYEFTWGEFCDWYLEFAKRRYYGEDPAEKETARAVTWTVLSGILHLLHPFMPFLSEELWSFLPGPGRNGEPLIRRPWPKAILGAPDARAVAATRFTMETITAIRNLRSEMNVAPGKGVEVVVRSPAAEAGILEELAGYVRSLARVDSLTVAPGAPRPKVAAAAVVGEAEVFLSLAGAIDLEGEAERLARELARIEKQAAGVEGKLMNEDFRRKAPPAVVEQVEEQLKLLRETRAKLEQNLAVLKGGES